MTLASTWMDTTEAEEEEGRGRNRRRPISIQRVSLLWAGRAEAVLWVAAA